MQSGGAILKWCHFFLGVLQTPLPHVTQSHYCQVPPLPPCHRVKSDSQFFYTCPSRVLQFFCQKFKIDGCIWVKYDTCKVFNTIILYFCHIYGYFGVNYVKGDHILYVICHMAVHVTIWDYPPTVTQSHYFQPPTLFQMPLAMVAIWHKLVSWA